MKPDQWRIDQWELKAIHGKHVNDEVGLGPMNPQLNLGKARMIYKESYLSYDKRNPSHIKIGSASLEWKYNGIRGRWMEDKIKDETQGTPLRT